MIRIQMPANETLEELIDRAVPAAGKKKSWRDRAKTYTKKFRTNKEFIAKGAPDWGEIKEIYVVLQSAKCAYCEKYLEASERLANANVGAVEQDVEHFRPKNSVKAWTPNVPLGFPFGNGTPRGYYMLALDIWNYCVACKTCNTRYKADRFPIEGKAGRRGDWKIKGLNTGELPLLFYPLSPDDDDPEACISFTGYRPVVRATAAGRQQRRALATIRFFDLDVRENLLRQRSEVIVSLYRALRDSVMEKKGQRRADAERDVKRMLSDRSNHANCARAYRAAFVNDSKTAHRVLSGSTAAPGGVAVGASSSQPDGLRFVAQSVAVWAPSNFYFV